MKLRTALALAFSIVAVSAHAEKIALAGGTLIARASDIRRVMKNGILYPADVVTR